MIAPRIETTPRDAYFGMVVSFNRGSYRYSLLLATSLRRWLETDPQAFRFPRKWIPVVLEIEAESLRRTSPAPTTQRTHDAEAERPLPQQVAQG